MHFLLWLGHRNIFKRAKTVVEKVVSTIEQVDTGRYGRVFGRRERGPFVQREKNEFCGDASKLVCDLLIDGLLLNESIELDDCLRTHDTLSSMNLSVS
ncbi:hypothetical protein BpHYR1_035230 [Brachionus plicatilis]|uniref:Uncharacterized protein n=1 Tax=Brachionus plicatilis TaxID=10195 RepID=A0A3M7T9H6_BRAPC|nr:hypothetical protein BpHYR1_035230 [Brachionus plicatilis]